MQWVSRDGYNQSQFEACLVWILSLQREKDEVLLWNSTIILERLKLTNQYLYLLKEGQSQKEYWANKVIQQAGIVVLLTWHLDWINIPNVLGKQRSSMQIHLV